MSGKEVVARLSSFGKKFEILVDSEKIADYKSGKLRASDIVIGDGIFLDLRSAIRAPEDLLRQVFKTDDFQKICEDILRRGEIQLTQEARREMLEQKKKRIISYISAHSIDARTGAPIPPARIEAAISDAKIRIDPIDSPESQIQGIVRALTPILPIKFENRRMAFRVPVGYAPQCKSAIQRIGTIIREDWSADYWLVETEFPAGMQDELFGKLNAITHGNVESKVISK